MYLKRPRPTTDQELRSLLQKAVRRGADKIVEQVTYRIDSQRDRSWLRSRAVVITFEEAWPMAAHLELTRDVETKKFALLRVSRVTKQKDAAGLGALAFAFHEGDTSMLDLVPSVRPLQIISEGLVRRDAYFEWLLAECRSGASQRVVEAARKYIAAATWGWDRATILAGAFLAAFGEIPPLMEAPALTRPFPYWTALDKHTPAGKDTFRDVARKHAVPYRQLIWAGFYFESAVVNGSVPSPWFEVERAWRLRKAGLDEGSAAALWRRLRPDLAARLSERAALLRARAEAPNALQPPLLPE